MLKNISKKTIVIIAVVLIVIAVSGYFYWSNLKESKNAPETNPIENVEKATDKIIEGAVKGVLPSLQTNPLENKPDINPATKANPIKNIKTNPFE